MLDPGLVQIWDVVSRVTKKNVTIISYLVLPDHEGVRREMKAYAACVSPANVKARDLTLVARLVDSDLSETNVVVRYV